MLKQELIEKNPIRHLNAGGKGNKLATRMGMVMSRAGQGKTAMLVQIALDAMFNGKQVVHVSVGQTLEKTKLWYDDIFKDIADTCKLSNPYEIYEEIVRNRMIMTFKESELSGARLEERLNDLVYQNIIHPSCVVVDGYDFSKAEPEVLKELRELAAAKDLQIWFSALSDSEVKPESGLPGHFARLGEYFDTVVLLKTDKSGDSIKLNILKDVGGLEDGAELRLDPITFMVQEAG